MSSTSIVAYADEQIVHESHTNSMFFLLALASAVYYCERWNTYCPGDWLQRVVGADRVPDHLGRLDMIISLLATSRRDDQHVTD
jgi:hypothetical protein